MDVSVPYTDGLQLGSAIDARTMKPMLPKSEIPPRSEEVNNTALQYSFVSTFKDVCDVLDVPPEYALKVEADIINNKVVSSCLKALHIKDSFTLFFRGRFEKRKHNLKDRQDQSSAEESGIPRQSSLISGNYTHWVRAVEVGNEIILLVTLVSSDPDKKNKLKTKWTKCLGSSSRDSFSRDKLKDMKKVAKETDKKLSKKDYRDTKLHVGYGFFHALNSYPNTMSGAVEALENFSNQCQKWIGLCSPKQEYLFQASAMDWKIGETVTSEEISRQGAGEPCVRYHAGSSSRAESLDFGGDHGIVVLYTLKVTMKALEKDDSKADKKANNNQESTSKLFEDLYYLLISYKNAVYELQAFLDSLDINKEFGQSEGKKVLKSISDTYEGMLDSVRQLDMITVPDVSTTDDIEQRVNVFKETVTTKLPPGGDLDLLLIGKTGHGKSSTGNSILGRQMFKSSASGESVTSKCGVGWTEVDKRIIKVVDTPGMFDTSFLITEQSRDLAMRSFSDAIVHCPEGFNALLLILRFGTRVTKEEKATITLLKRALGEDIIKDHCICVITHGESFDQEMAKSKTTFKQWCRSQKGFLGDLFKECDYRCVLFKNMTTDAKTQKTQLVNLVANVDKMKGRYTNSLFEFANNERKRIQSEKGKAAIRDDLVRDFHLMLGSLNRIIHKTNTEDRNRIRQELGELKTKVDSLMNRLSEVENDNLNDLFKHVSDLAKTIDMMMISDPQLQETTDVNSNVSASKEGEVTQKDERETTEEKNVSDVSISKGGEVSEKDERETTEVKNVSDVSTSKGGEVSEKDERETREEKVSDISSSKEGEVPVKDMRKTKKEKVSDASPTREVETLTQNFHKSKHDKCSNAPNSNKKKNANAKT